MGAAIVSVGSKGGKPLFTFNAAGQDTGSLLPLIWEAQRYGKWFFQLSGTGTGFTITVYGTLDVPTAYQQAGNSNSWFGLPAPSNSGGDAFQYANPITLDAPNTNILFCNQPIICPRAVSSLTTGFGSVTGTVTLLAFAIP